MQFWLKKQGIRAAFLDRNSERQLFMRIQSFSGSGSRSESLQVLEHNRQLVSEYFGWPALRLSMGVQVHGNQIDEVVSPGLSEHTDGLVTQIVGVGLAVLVADCSAVLLADRSNRVIAAIHAGWRGALKDILPKAVEKMIRLGAETDLMDAFLSPCIST